MQFHYTNNDLIDFFMCKYHAGNVPIMFVPFLSQIEKVIILIPRLPEAALLSVWKTVKD